MNEQKREFRFKFDLLAILSRASKNRSLKKMILVSIPQDPTERMEILTSEFHKIPQKDTKVTSTSIETSAREVQGYRRNGYQVSCDVNSDVNRGVEARNRSEDRRSIMKTNMG